MVATQFNLKHCCKTKWVSLNSTQLTASHNPWVRIPQGNKYCNNRTMPLRISKDLWSPASRIPGQDITHWLGTKDTNIDMNIGQTVETIPHRDLLDWFLTERQHSSTQLAGKAVGYSVEVCAARASKAAKGKAQRPRPLPRPRPRPRPRPIGFPVVGFLDLTLGVSSISKVSRFKLSGRM